MLSSSNSANSHFARFSDGKTAAARNAQVRIDLSGLDVSVEDPIERFRWPYDTLRAGEPIRPHSVDVLLNSSATPGATLFIPGANFATELAKRAPHLTAKAERWRHARPWMIGAGAIAAFFVFLSVSGWSPIRTIAALLPQSWRDRLGAATIQSIAEDKKRCTDTSGIAALEKLSARLTNAAGNGTKFKVTVVDWSLMNAFAAPGNQIVMTKGLIEKADSADEVAGVLAHEMGHGIEMHPETGIIRAVGLAAAVELMLGGTGGTLANLGLVLAQLGYTRVAEREADRQALELLKTSGISQQGLLDFFKRVQKIEGGDEISKAIKSFDMLRTHPPTEERAELIRRQPSYPSTPALDAASWDALKGVCSKTETAGESGT